jgi:antitoxin (DNA-binding transcriptional repressor) of toxin-antitoxin stability system
MHKINLEEAETCLAELVKEAAKGEDVIITQGDGSAFQLIPIQNLSNRSQPNRSSLDQEALFNPEGIWDQANRITSQDIAEARKEMWHKFDQEGQA